MKAKGSDNYDTPCIGLCNLVLNCISSYTDIKCHSLGINMFIETRSSIICSGDNVIGRDAACRRCRRRLLSKSHASSPR